MGTLSWGQKTNSPAPNPFVEPPPFLPTTVLNDGVAGDTTTGLSSSTSGNIQDGGFLAQSWTGRIAIPNGTMIDEIRWVFGLSGYFGFPPRFGALQAYTEQAVVTTANWGNPTSTVDLGGGNILYIASINPACYTVAGVFIYTTGPFDLQPVGFYQYTGQLSDFRIYYQGAEVLVSNECAAGGGDGGGGGGDADPGCGCNTSYAARQRPATAYLGRRRPTTVYTKDC